MSYSRTSISPIPVSNTFSPQVNEEASLRSLDLTTAEKKSYSNMFKSRTHNAIPNILYRTALEKPCTLIQSLKTVALSSDSKDVRLRLDTTDTRIEIRKRCSSA
ncbi:Hypothetical predicted protein [Octopus vulgaris]|uniref:Uncharacterized protein n=1 Tax=Octopus vulgaris TaxID=6645 RepID=A0AA36EVQ2_OCTVU|nr:Hypothetical predicted protein [Octopus vulgaris]